jgi:hypothetical protein
LSSRPILRPAWESVSKSPLSLSLSNPACSAIETSEPSASKTSSPVEAYFVWDNLSQLLRVANDPEIQEALQPQPDPLPEKSRARVSRLLTHPDMALLLYLAKEALHRPICASIILLYTNTSPTTPVPCPCLRALASQSLFIPKPAALDPEAQTG